MNYSATYFPPLIDGPAFVCYTDWASNIMRWPCSYSVWIVPGTYPEEY